CFRVVVLNEDQPESLAVHRVHGPSHEQRLSGSSPGVRAVVPPSASRVSDHLPQLCSGSRGGTGSTPAKGVCAAGNRLPATGSPITTRLVPLPALAGPPPSSSLQR